MSPSDHERIAYLAGDPAESLGADERAQLDALRDLLRSPATWIEPDPTLEDRVVEAIADEAAGARTTQPEASSGPTAPPASPPRPRPWQRWRPRRPALAFGGLAAALAVALAVVLIATGSESRTPQRFAMTVSGTALAPTAHGSATLTKTASGWRIELRATGLPRLSGAQFFYQAWLKNPAGTLVPVGTFNDARQVTLWSGVPVTKYRTLTVTIQPANGTPTSSGRRVLIGTIRATG